jgi:hypothetical protein
MREEDMSKVLPQWINIPLSLDLFPEYFKTPEPWPLWHLRVRFPGGSYLPDRSVTNAN